MRDSSRDRSRLSFHLRPCVYEVWTVALMANTDGGAARLFASAVSVGVAKGLVSGGGDAVGLLLHASSLAGGRAVAADEEDGIGVWRGI